MWQLGHILKFAGLTLSEIFSLDTSQIQIKLGRLMYYVGGQLHLIAKQGALA